MSLCPVVVELAALKALRNWLKGLADKLGAAVGATRAIVDAGWRPYAEQVGADGEDGCAEGLHCDRNFRARCSTCPA